VRVLNAENIIVSPIVIAPLTRKVLVDNAEMLIKEIHFREKEFACLYYLGLHAGEWVPRKRLGEFVIDGRPYDVSRQLIEQYIHRVRKKLSKASPDLGKRIISRRGFGYKLAKG